MKHKIIKLTPQDDYLSGIGFLLNAAGIKDGDKFSIRFKRGLRWKLKAFKLLAFSHHKCECCGSYTVMILQKGDEKILIDNHFGPSSLLPKLKEIKKSV